MQYIIKHHIQPFTSVFLRIWQLAWKTHAWFLTGYLVATVLESALPAALALTGRGLINSLVAALAQQTNNLSSLLPWLVLGATLSISSALISNLSAYWQYRLQNEITLQVGIDVLRQMARLDLAFLESHEAQDQIEHARRYGVGLVAQVLFKVVALLHQCLRLGSLVVIMWWLEPLVMGWLVLLALPYMVFRWRLAERIYALHHQRIYRRRQTNYYAGLLAHSRSLPEVKLLGLAPLFIERLRTLDHEFFTADRQLYQRSLLGNTLFAVAGALTLYTLFGRIAGRVLAGVLTVGDVALYMGGTLQLQGIIQSLVQTISSLKEQLLHVTDLQAFLDIEPHPPILRPRAGQVAQSFDPAQDKSPNPSTLHRTSHPLTQSLSHPRTDAITFDNVSFTYPDNEQPALVNLSFCLQAGETVAVVGENGAGKSTLAMLLAGLYIPTAGSIWVDGVDLREMDPAAWQQRIGFVFQKFNAYEATVRENIAFGNWSYLSRHPAAVEQIARLAKADTLIEQLPQGYETVLGRQFAKHELSLGQCQKLALARGLARTNARLLILDEPSASLDARAEYELFSRFRQAAAGRTTLLISHRFSTISMADRILVLEKGRLLESGRHQELLARGGQYAMLYRLHQQQYSSFTDSVVPNMT